MRTTSEIAEAFGLELLGHERLGQEQAAKNRVEISSVAISSIDCQPGSLFIAVQGQNAHGIDFLASATAAGAVAVLSDRAVQTDLPHFIHPDPRIIAGALSAFVMETMDLGLQIFAVTGTNGKTSTGRSGRAFLLGIYSNRSRESSKHIDHPGGASASLAAGANGRRWRKGCGYRSFCAGSGKKSD